MINRTFIRSFSTLNLSSLKDSSLRGVINNVSDKMMEQKFNNIDERFRNISKDIDKLNQLNSSNTKLIKVSNEMFDQIQRNKVNIQENSRCIYELQDRENEYYKELNNKYKTFNNHIIGNFCFVCVVGLLLSR